MSLIPFGELVTCNKWERSVDELDLREVTMMADYTGQLAIRIVILGIKS